MELMATLHQSVIDGNAAGVRDQMKQTLAQGVAPEKVLNDGLISAMSEVGSLFSCGEYYVPEMLIAARAMKAGLELLRPALVSADVPAIGKVVLGTVKGDLHDIGKNLVSMMLEGAGFEVIDLGVDVPPEKFIQAIQDHHPNAVGLSALLTTTMPAMKTTIDAIKSAGLREQVKGDGRRRAVDRQIRASNRGRSVRVRRVIRRARGTRNDRVMEERMSGAVQSLEQKILAHQTFWRGEVLA